MICLSPDKEKILLTQLYGKEKNILVAGYVNPGLEAEEAVVREVKEELGVSTKSLRFNHSHFYASSETLMLNFEVVLNREDLPPNWEIDSYRFYAKEDARKAVVQGSLAHDFLNGYLDGVYSFGDKKWTEKRYITFSIT